MLRPIPAKMLKQTAVFHVCLSTDTWESPTRKDIQISRVCLQPILESRIDRDNTLVYRRGLLFIDAKLSTKCDPEAFQRESLKNGMPLTVTVGEYERTVDEVSTIMDDEGGVHHWELTLV